MADDKNTQIISGFAFSDSAMIDMALKEENAVNYLQGQIDYNKPETVLSVYQKLVHQKVFHTAVGTAFLHDLQRYLSEAYQSTGQEPRIHHPQVPAFSLQSRASDVCGCPAYQYGLQESY